MRPSSSTRLPPLAHRLRRRFEALAADPAALVAAPVRVLIACSGGPDSMTLLHASLRAARAAKAEIAVAHVHHGASDDPELTRARERALAHARDFALRCDLPCFIAGPELAPPGLRSEADLRAYRRLRLQELASEAGAPWIALAHHADDLFETRLIRLIRGTGEEGLEAMRERRGIWWRPFLREPRAELARYAHDLRLAGELSWIDDPSNADPGPLRNWLRLRWLPELEAKRPGASAAMARSLAGLAARAAGAVDPAIAAATELARADFTAASPTERRRLVARAMKSAGAVDLTSSRVAEVCKRLLSRRREFGFAVGGLEWSINAERISLRRPSRT